MPQKTFNIGERSYYGRWKIEVKGDRIIVTGMDWDTRKVEATREFTVEDAHSGDLEFYLTDISTCYHAGEMMKWVKKHIPEFKGNIYSLW
jgi:hypothetical protein